MSKRLSELTAVHSGAREINVLRMAAAAAPLETVTIGGDVYQVNVGSGVVAGRISVDVSAGGAKSVGTLTSDATAPSDGDTVTIDGKVYTFKTTLTPTEGQVLIGASAAIALDNLKLAINRTAPDTNDGVKYKIAAAHSTVSATTNTDTTQVVQALITGVAGDLLATTESGSHTEWGAATLASGADPTAEQFIDAMVLAIAASNTQGIAAAKISATELLIYSVVARSIALACTETLAGTNNSWSAAAMYGGAAAAIKKQQAFSRVPTAAEVVHGNMHFMCTFTPTKVFTEVVVTSSGVPKVWLGGVTITGNRVTLDNAGATDWAATDTVRVLAIE